MLNPIIVPDTLKVKIDKVMIKIINDMDKMNKREREEYWRGLSDFEKGVFTIALLKKTLKY